MGLKNKLSNGEYLSGNLNVPEPVVEVVKYEGKRTYTAQTNVDNINKKISVDVLLDNELNNNSTRPVTNRTITYEVNSLQEVLRKKVDKEVGKGLSSNDFTDEDKQKLDTFPDADKIIKGINIGDTPAPIERNIVTIPVASFNSFGVVKSSNEEDKVNVNEAGEMVINDLHISKLVQDTAEYLVLDGSNMLYGVE